MSAGDRVRDLGLDLGDGRIYWGDRDTNKVQRMRLDGVGGIEDLFNVSEGLDRPHGMALDLEGGMIYWADTQTRSIVRGAMDGSGSPQTLYQAGLTEPWDIEIVVPEPSVAWVVMGLGVAQILRRRRKNSFSK
jgi:hypothetical protein